MRLLAQCIRSIARTGKRHTKQKLGRYQTVASTDQAITGRMAQAVRRRIQLALTCPIAACLVCTDIVTYLIMKYTGWFNAFWKVHTGAGVRLA